MGTRFTHVGNPSVRSNFKVWVRVPWKQCVSCLWCLPTMKVRVLRTSLTNTRYAMRRDSLLNVNQHERPISSVKVWNIWCLRVLLVLLQVYSVHGLQTARSSSSSSCALPPASLGGLITRSGFQPYVFSCAIHTAVDCCAKFALSAFLSQDGQH